MRTRVLRITATLAGAAALALAAAGTAAADSFGEDSYGKDGKDGGSSATDSDDSEQQTPEIAHDNLDGETMSPGVHEPGLLNFDAPTIKTT